MKITHEIIELHTTHPFNIARAAAPPVRRSVWVRVTTADGVEGWGEAAGTPYYGETAETVIGVLPLYERALQALGDDAALETAERAVEQAAGGNPGARAAVSAALHDIAGRRANRAVWQMWGLDRATLPLSSFTLGIDTPEVMQRKLEEAASYPILKLKVGTPDDRAILELVRRAAPDKLIRIDANTGWSLAQALAMLPLLEELGIELIEQPFKADDLESFRQLRGRTAIPVVADESCRVAADVPRLAGAVDGVNIKLEKCGSLREALRIVHVARAHHMKVMVGCMMSTTLAIAAAMQVAPLVDWADLDAAALLADDPFTGPRMHEDGSMTLTDEPGLGVTRR